MTPSVLHKKIVVERIEWVREMIARLRSLPLESYDSFRSDPRNVAAAESYLRRGLEALMDLGRHILAKGFGKAVPEYKQIADELIARGILSKKGASVLRELGGYRNRMVHFYHEISDQEIYEICSGEVSDIEDILEMILSWLRDHPDMIDSSL